MITIPNTAPQTQEEYDFLIDAVYKNGLEQYEKEKAQVTAKAKEVWVKLPEKQRPPLEDFIFEQLSIIREPRTKAQIDAEFSCYRPQPEPLDMPENISMPLDQAFYQLADGRVYSVAEGDFTRTRSAQHVIQVPGGTEEDLKNDILRFYNLPVGVVLLTFDEFREQKLEELAVAFDKAQTDGKLMSSAGFEIDANEKANRNIGGLITAMEDTNQQTTMFCDANNEFHSVSLGQLKTMQLEVITYGQELYQKKWKIREAINSATTKDALAEISISF